MGQVKETNIKNQIYYFFDDIINVKNFHPSLLKIDKNSYKDSDIYYIGYITITKFGYCKNIHSVNLLYLIFHSAAGHFKEKNDKKYLILHSTDEYEEVWSGIRSEIETLNGEKELLYKKTMLELELILMMIYL